MNLLWVGVVPWSCKDSRNVVCLCTYWLGITYLDRWVKDVVVVVVEAEEAQNRAVVVVGTALEDVVEKREVGEVEVEASMEVVKVVGGGEAVEVVGLV